MIPDKYCKITCSWFLLQKELRLWQSEYTDFLAKYSQYV